MGWASLLVEATNSDGPPFPLRVFQPRYLSLLPRFESFDNGVNLPANVGAYS